MSTIELSKSDMLFFSVYTGRPHALTEQSVHTLNRLQQSFDALH